MHDATRSTCHGRSPGVWSSAYSRACIRISPPACTFVLALGGMIAGLMTGCGTPVTVDALARPGANTVTYELRSAAPTMKDDELRYHEAAGYVRTALSGKGMFEAPRHVKPDVVVSVAFGVGPPQIRKEVHQVPRFETPRGSDSPSPELKTGYEEHVITTITYEKYLRLVAQDSSPAAPGRPPAEIWTVDVTSEGKSRDLRKHLPLLVAASIDFVGKDSRGQKTIRIKDTDADVIFVKAGMPGGIASTPSLAK